MFTRRHFCCAGAVAGFMSSHPAFAAHQCAIFTKERQAGITPEVALRELKAGNERFITGKSVSCDLVAQVKATAGGQFPFAAVVGCIDSRVPPELVFDQRIGALFIARVAGNFVNPDIAGSLEYATKVAGAKLILVLGHSDCGAIKGAIDGAQLGNLTQMLEKIKPAVEASAASPGEHSSKNKAFVQTVAEANARMTVKRLMEMSQVIGEMASKNEIKVVSAMHDVSSGRVTFAA